MVTVKREVTVTGLTLGGAVELAQDSQIPAHATFAYADHLAVLSWHDPPEPLAPGRLAHTADGNHRRDGGPPGPVTVAAEPITVEFQMIREPGITLGDVWLPLSLLDRLGEQDVWDSEFGNPFIEADPKQERVLLGHGLAVKETRGGLHRSPDLAAFMKRLKFPPREPS